MTASQRRRLAVKLATREALHYILDRCQSTEVPTTCQIEAHLAYNLQYAQAEALHRPQPEG